MNENVVGQRLEGRKRFLEYSNVRKARLALDKAIDPYPLMNDATKIAVQLTGLVLQKCWLGT